MCFSTCWWSSACRCGHVTVRVQASRYPGHSLGLVVLIVTVGSLCPVLLFFVILRLDRNRTFPCPLPLLLSKPFSSPRKTTFFLNFLHNLIETCTHLPLTFPFISPLLLWYPPPPHTRVYYSRCIFSIPFSQTSILIDNYRDNKNLPLGSLKNSLSASV